MQPLMRFLFVLAWALPMGLMGCSEPPASSERVGEEEGEPDPLRIIAVNAPLAYFADRLGQGFADVDVLAPAGEDPALWQPEVEDVLAMQSADLILLNGAGYEPWLERVSLPEAGVLNTSDALVDRLIQSESITHQHGPDGAHSHAETAFTLWLDPMLAVEQAGAIASAIAALRPAEAVTVASRMDGLESDLLGLHEAWLRIASAVGSAPLLFSHPVYQYFERRYQLNGRSLHWEADQDPGESQWSSIAALLASHPAAIMVWEAEPLPETARRLRDLGVSTVVVDPAAAPDADETFFERQLANVERFEAALEPQ